MFKELFRIGEISRLLKINITALRYYDETGLLKPAYIEPKTGYRYYSAEQFEQLNTIRYLKALDVPLADIKAFLSERNVASILEILKKQHQNTFEKIEELDRINQKIENRIAQIEYAEERRKEAGVIRKVHLPCRYIVELKNKIKPEDDLEIPIRVLENSVNLENSIFLGKVGLKISKEKLELGDFETYDSIFLILEGESVAEDMRINVPAGQYLSLSFKGGHRDAQPYYRQLIRYAKDMQLTVLDDSLETTLIDRGLTSDAEAFVTEIQLLVQKD